MKDATEALSRLLPPAALSAWHLDGGLQQIPMAAPATEQEFREVIELAGRSNYRVLPLGSGSKLTHQPTPERVDILLSTRRYTGCVAYEPGDGTLTARAGTTWAELEGTARGGGHHLTPSIARPASATLGGVLAQGQSGFDRLRYGPLRHHVLGMRVLGADAAVTKSGGRLVKNVTGFELTRLHCGSRGSLGLILEASLRLFPEPMAMCIVSTPAGERQACARSGRELLVKLWRPYALLWEDVLSPDGGCCLHVVLAGHPEQVSADRSRLLRELEGTVALEKAEARALYERLRELECPQAGRPVWRIECRPGRLAGVLEVTERILASGGHAWRCSVHPGLATVDLWPAEETRGSRPGAGLQSVITALRDGLRTKRARIRARSAAALPQPAPSYGEGLELMQTLRCDLDPDGLFASDLFRPQAVPVQRGTCD